MQHLALRDDVAVVEALEHEAREREVRGGRADVDADARQPDLVLDFEAAADAREEDPAAFFPAHIISPSPPSAARRTSRAPCARARRSSRASPRIPCAGT